MNKKYNEKTLCPLPWMHLSVHFDESLRVCCNGSKGREVSNDQGQLIYFPEVADFSQVINNNFYKNVRSQMMKGELPSFCDYCEKVDKSGGSSPREHFYHQYKNQLQNWLVTTKADGTIDAPLQGPLFLDFSLSNHCNLRCRMCSPEFSAGLKGVFNKLELEYPEEAVERALSGWNFSEQQKSQFKTWFSSMDKILLQGGEPLLTKEAKQFLQLAVDCGESHHIHLKITTNLTQLDQEWLKLLPQFKAVALHVSLEGTKSFNEYIRQGSEQTVIYQNIKKLKKLQSLMPLYFDIYTVFQVYNVHNIIPFIKECLNEFKTVPFIGFLRFPHFLSPNILPKHIKENVRREIEDFLKTVDYSAIDSLGLKNLETLQAHLDLMDETPKDIKAQWQKCKEYTKGLDNHYQTDLKAIDPVLGREIYHDS